jgi:crotonobetainyl-CoA:carnitine CoA-transferase CaiB-like acyl-CoA transferase
MDRSSFTPQDSVAYIWTQILGLPKAALNALDIPIDAACCPSSFKVDNLAQSTIALSALSAALFHSRRQQCEVPKVTVAAEHACVEFKSERLYTLNGKPAPPGRATIGGLYKTADGYVRVHDSFLNHRQNAMKILDLFENASKDQIAKKMLEWKSVDLEDEAFRRGAVIAALRSYENWDILPQARAIPDLPIIINRVTNSPPYIPEVPTTIGRNGCLQGIRVVELSRVIAAPVAGKTLAVHGATVIWVTSPNLPDLPSLDIDLSRGKRTVQIDAKHPDGKSQLLELLRTADVFIQR